jgi:two-component system NtrC family sensor kinase
MPGRVHFGRSSLRVRVVTAVGLVVITLLAAVSLLVLLQTRRQIIGQQRENAVAVARTFAIPAVDAMIMGDEEPSASTEVLENHVRTFLAATEGVLSVSIVDVDGRVLAHSNPRLTNRTLGDSAARHANRLTAPASAVFEDEDGRWVTEAAVPLELGARRWGSVLIRFDAEPLRVQIRRLFVQLFLLTLFIASATLGLLFVLVDSITSSLRALVDEIDQIDFASERPSALAIPSNEIGYLIRHFELLKGRLAQSRRELSAVQNQVYQAEKLASVGRLASGVAHEVNNPLNGIRFCLHGIQADPLNVEQTQRYVALIDEAISQIESVVQKLLGFARNQPASFEMVNLNDQLRVVLDLVEFQFRKKEVAMQVALQADLPLVRADATLMKEVFMNLLMNSIDAIEVAGSIRVQSGEADDGRVFVSITDNGVGIADEHRSKIFEPFFTTKDTGRGTGLGLSVTLGIVELHGGTIKVHSEPRVQTTFTVELPREGAA